MESQPVEERGRVRIPRNDNNNLPASPPSSNPIPPPPPLSQFHLVLVIDKPDPVSFNSAPSLLYDTLYEEIAFKWTAAAFAEQCRTGWVARECARLGSIIEDSINRREFGRESGKTGRFFNFGFTRLIDSEILVRRTDIPWKQAHEEAFRVSPLAQSIKDLYIGLKTKSSAQVMVGDIPIDFRLPQRAIIPSEEWTKWGDPLSESSESENEDDDEWDEYDMDRTTRRRRYSEKGGIELRPWKTLLKLKMGNGKLGMVGNDYEENEFEEIENIESLDILLAALDPSLT